MAAEAAAFRIVLLKSMMHHLPVLNGGSTKRWWHQMVVAPNGSGTKRWWHQTVAAAGLYYVRIQDHVVTEYDALPSSTKR